MVKISQAADKSIISMDHEAIRLYQMYRECRVAVGMGRDKLQHTEECDEFRAAFNDEMGLQLDRRGFWIVLQRLLKKGENRIEPYLAAQGIDYPPR